MKFNYTLYAFISIFIFACTPKNDNIQKEFYPNGNIKTIMEVKNGKRNGLTKNFDEQGRLESTAELKDDKYEGWMINYNKTNGKITAKALYKNDKQNGPAKLYYASGELYREMTYVDGHVDSIVKTYWANGKLQAEVFFKMGDPGTGLKEWDKQGNPIKQPTIIVEEVNQLALFGTFSLKIYLSDHSSDVDFYYGNLIDGKFLNKKLGSTYDNNGVVTLNYDIPRGHTHMEKLSIIAKTRTKFGNTLVLFRNYNLAISN